MSELRSHVRKVLNLRTKDVHGRPRALLACFRIVINLRSTGNLLLSHELFSSGPLYLVHRIFDAELISVLVRKWRSVRLGSLFPIRLCIPLWRHGASPLEAAL